MKIKPIAAALLTLGALSAGNIAVADEVSDRIAELERQLEELKNQVSANQQSTTANAEEIEQVRPVKKGTKFTYGGFIQLDAMATNYSEGKPGNDLIDDLLVPSLIPVEPASGKSSSYSSYNMHAKTSRLYFTTNTPTDAGDISTRIEMDFIVTADGDERISNSWHSRLRHAFVKWQYGENSSLLAGQTWSTFFNVGALPDVQDFVGPVGTIFNRQPMLRWTMGGLQLALENPATRLNNFTVDGVSSGFDEFSEGMPDLIARYNGKAGGLGWSLAGMARELTYDTGSRGESDEQYVYALSFAGKWQFGKNDLRFMLNYGDGLGRYMGLNSFNDGYINLSGDIKTIDQIGGFIAYRHFWSDRWRSTFSISASEADNPGEGRFVSAGSLAKAYESFHANLNYLPAPNLSLGGEIILANKELEDGRDGDLSRFQFSVKYGF